MQHFLCKIWFLCSQDIRNMHHSCNLSLPNNNCIKLYHINELFYTWLFWCLELEIWPKPDDVSPKPSANICAKMKFLHNVGNICIFPSLQSNMFSMKPPPILTLLMQGFKITFIDNHAIQNIQEYLWPAWGVLKLSSEMILFYPL